MTSTSHTRPSLPLRGRSFRALVLAPERPLDDWFAQLDALVLRSPTLFAERPVILDVAGLAQPAPAPSAAGPEEQAGETGADPDATAPAEAATPDLSRLLAELDRRGIRIMGIEKADPGWTTPAMPPRLSGGRPAEMAPPPEPEKPKLSSLVLETPLRSGQTIYHPDGDVTVMGSVSSGAEILAGGSIHVYGALRGRAIAGAGGNRGARIYCRKFQPELLGIDGLFRTAETTDPGLRGKPVQVWLERDAIRMAALD
ncbi:septum site-determining protein MinC [Methylobacterium nodulans]|uniref:septum site-determining protein MinC n=1 Tax=Methylobacterium nodulans TaxID=114616 RepID=UPI00031C325B|nr:septum site-determining protein MinC [Methylobacterium nodulans]